MTKRALLFAIPLAAGIATPASSQGLLAALFGFDAAPPSPRYYDHRVLPRVPPSALPLPRATRRASRPKAETAETKRPVIKVEAPPKPITPKPMGEVENPLPKLLADATLRDGDIVVFPEGPRVFKGRVGTKHHLDDFAAITNTSVGSRTRKLLATMKIGPAVAWSEDTGPKNKMAARDVETTGSLKNGSVKLNPRQSRP
jgi:hypothetical protein